MVSDNKIPPASPGNIALSDEQVRSSIDAALIVLEGASPDSVLRMLDRIVVAKVVLRGIATGAIVLAPAPKLEVPATAGAGGRDAARRKSPSGR